MTYRNNKSTRRNTLAGIIAASIAIAALIIIVSVVGDPAGRKNAGEGIASSGTQPTTQSADAATTTSKEKESQTTTETTSEATTETTTETTTTTEVTTPASDSKGMNPKYYEEAIDTEREAEKRVYLTFDDGPSVNTGDILDILKKYGIKATFYNIGTDSEEMLELQRRVYDEGHTLAIHSVSHDYSQIYSSFENWKADVLGEQERIKDNVGITTKYYRFPGGGSNSKGSKYGTSIRDCAAWLDENGFSYQDWNIDSRDADGNEYTPEQMAQNIIDDITGSEKTDFIVLMHDAKPKTTTVKCLPKVIETLQAKGYTFCQITDNTVSIHHNFYEG